jgi:hypothetical protein
MVVEEMGRGKVEGSVNGGQVRASRVSDVSASSVVVT